MTHVAEPRQRALSGAPDQRIRPLSPDVVNLIAAWEIIQRPANAARELLEHIPRHFHKDLLHLFLRLQ